MASDPRKHVHVKFDDCRLCLHMRFRKFNQITKEDPCASCDVGEFFEPNDTPKELSAIFRD